jgi:tetratricopeptide (TPR) repeat protein
MATYSKRADESDDGTIIRLAQQSIDREDQDVQRTELSTVCSASSEVRFDGAAQLGRFRLIRTLGHGSFGVVILAFDPRLQREVALKFPRPELLAMRRWRRRIIHEARSAASLDHPGIVPVFEVGRIGPVHYIASGYCDGPTLNQWQRAHAPGNVRVAVELVAQIADAVQHAHSRGILHRDLKPANVLLKMPVDPGESAKPVALVTDFGLASSRLRRGKWSGDAGMAGTLAYMAPEQTFAGQQQLAAAVDVYALGAILFELLSGRPPFAAHCETELVERIRHEPIRAVCELRPEVPRDLEAICATCLAKLPSERYDSAAELARDLRRFLTGHCVQARPVGMPVRALRWSKRRPVVAALSAALFVAVCCGSTLCYREWRRAEANLRHAEEAVVNLGWAIEDSMFWRIASDSYGGQQRDELTRRYAELLQQLDNGPAARPIRAAAECFYARLASISGDSERARVTFEKSISQWYALVRANPGNSFNRRSLAKTLYYFAHLLHCDSESNRGLALLDKDGRFGLGLFQASGMDRLVMQDYADILFEKAEAHRQRDFDSDAAMHYASCIEVCRRITAANPIDIDARFRILQSQVRQGLVKRPAASKATLYELQKNTIEELRALVGQHPERREFRIEHANAASWMATHAEKLGHAEVVDEYLAEALDSLERALIPADCPLDVKHKYADALLFKARRHVTTNQFAEARACAQAALQWYNGVGPDSANHEHALAKAYYEVGEVYLLCGAAHDAMQALEQASTLYESSLRGQSRNRGTHLRQSDAYVKLSMLYENAGREADALNAAQAAVRVLEMWRGPNPDEPHVARRLSQLRSDASRLQVALRRG